MPVGNNKIQRLSRIKHTNLKIWKKSLAHSTGFKSDANESLYKFMNKIKWNLENKYILVECRIVYFTSILDTRDIFREAKFITKLKTFINFAIETYEITYSLLHVQKTEILNDCNKTA